MYKNILIPTDGSARCAVPRNQPLACNSRKSHVGCEASPAVFAAPPATPIVYPQPAAGQVTAPRPSMAATQGELYGVAEKRGGATCKLSVPPACPAKAATACACDFHASHGEQRLTRRMLVLETRRSSRVESATCIVMVLARHDVPGDLF